MTLVEAARAYLGAPFLHQGRSPAGMDCAGLALLALRDCGHAPADMTHYGRRPWRDGLQQAVEAFYGAPVRLPPQAGDLVLMANKPGGPPAHIAIVGDYVLGGLSLIHTRADVGRVVENRMDERELARIVAVYR